MRKKQILAFILVLCMAISLFPVGALAAEPEDDVTVGEALEEDSTTEVEPEEDSENAVVLVEDGKGDEETQEMEGNLYEPETNAEAIPSEISDYEQLNGDVGQNEQNYFNVVPFEADEIESESKGSYLHPNDAPPVELYDTGVNLMAADNAYMINNTIVRQSDFSSSENECWTYANNVYNKIWGHNFTNNFDDTENMLRNLSDSQLTLTADHLKEYVSAAALGSCLRICDSYYLHGSDGWGHSQIIVQKDSNGFTVLEGGLSDYPYRREAYYTWSNYADKSKWPGYYQYIKYIKWPGASNYWSDHNPQGFVDILEGGAGQIHVAGWAFDRDNLSQSLEIHVYIGGAAGSGEGHSGIIANISRPDVDAAFSGIGEYRGFDSTITTQLRGTQEVYVYAINLEGGDNSLLHHGTVTIAEPTPNYTLDINGLLDGNNYGFLDSYGTFDIYINGTLVADDVIDYCVDLPEGTQYEITDVCATNGHSFQYVAEGSLSGILNGHTSVRLAFRTVGSNMQAGYDRVIPDGDYIIVTAAAADNTSFYFLDIVGTEQPALSGTNVSLCGPHTGLDLPEYEIWTLKYSDGFYKIAQKGTDTVLEINVENSVNADVVQSLSSINELWAISSNGKNGYRIQSKWTGLSLDVKEGYISNGTNVQQRPTTDADSQSWLFIPYKPEQSLPDGRYVLVSAIGGADEFEAGIQTIDTVNNVQLYSSTAMSQYVSFDVTALGNGYYKLLHHASAQALDLGQGISTLGANINLNTDNGSMAQQWAIIPNGDGYLLCNGASGMFMLVAGDTVADGTNICQWIYTGSSWQTWKFVPAEYTIRYDLTNSDKVFDDQIKYYKGTLTLSSEIPVREGYVFLGWSDSKAATSVSYLPGAEFTSDQDTTLYAVWQEIAKPEPQVTSVSLNKTSLSLTTGGSAALTATVVPNNATNKNVSWTSDKTNIATVGDDGTVKALAAGTVTITVETEDGGFKAACVVTVIEPVPDTIPVASVSLDNTALTLTEGETASLTATVAPANATNKTVTWKSSEEAVVTVSKGAITAQSAGTATVTVITEDGGKTAAAEITVNPKPTVLERLEVSGDEHLETVEGMPLDLSGLVVTAVYSGDTRSVVTDYSVSDFDANTLGTQSLTISYGGKETTVNVTVVAKSVTGIAIASYPTKLSYIQGDPLNTGGLKVTVSYNNGAEAVVERGFTVTGYDGNTVGSQSVIVTYQDFTASFTVTVSEKPVVGDVSKPVIRMESVANGKRIILTSATEGAEIYYTTDGTAPTAASTRYTESFTVRKTLNTVKAVAILGTENSNIATGIISVSQVGAPDPNPGGGTVPAGTIVTLRSDTVGSEIYYTDGDGTFSKDTWTKYNGAIIIDRTKTIRAIAVKDGYVNSGITRLEYEVPVVELPKDNVVITLGSVTVAAGDIASIPVYLFTDSEETTISSFRVSFAFDKDSFENYVTLTPGDGIPDASSLYSSATGGVVNLLYQGEAISGGEICTLNFGTLASMAAGTEFDIEVNLGNSSITTNAVGGTSLTSVNAVITLTEARITEVNATFTYTTTSGQTAQRVSDIGDTNQVEVNATFEDAETGTLRETMANVYLAIYDRVGRMVSVDTWKVDLSDPAFMFIRTITIPEDVEVGAIKIMVLSDQMVPLMAAGELAK